MVVRSGQVVQLGCGETWNKVIVDINVSSNRLFESALSGVGGTIGVVYPKPYFISL